VDRHGHIGGLVRESSIDERDVLPRKLVNVLATILGALAHLVGLSTKKEKASDKGAIAPREGEGQKSYAKVSQISVVQLDVLALQKNRGIQRSCPSEWSERRDTYPSLRESSDLGAVNSGEILEEVVNVGV
jgi:hypothetical protein